MTVDVLGGIEIGYDMDGDGPVVLFTHGYQASRRMWDAQARALRDRYRVVTWDLRGHGESGAPDDPAMYSHELMLGDMTALLDLAAAHPPEPSGGAKTAAVLVGHSLGGYASLLYRLEHPERVRALVLFGSGPGYRDADARAKWNDMAERFARSVEERGLDILRKASAEVSSAMHRSPKALAHAARGMLAQQDSRVMDTITEIDVPTLVLIGSEDKPFIGSSEYMAKKIPGAELVVIEGAGHAASIEKPDEFNAALQGFLDRLD
jgi:pimeloyl-ACP methyl ester carboxylesterase